MPEIVEQEAPAVTLTTQGPAIPAASDQPAQKPSADEAPAKQEGEKPQEAKPTDEQPEKPGKNRFERRLDRAYRREAEQKARADLLEKRLAEIESKLPKAQTFDGEPRLDQFDDIEKYAQALAEFRAKKAVEAHEAKQRQQQAQQTQAQLSKSWEEKADKASTKYDDWDDVVGEIKPTNPLTVAIMRAANGEDVAYHLGKNLKEASRIAGLEPIAQIMAVGELSAKLALDPPKPKQPSKAPPPIAPLTGKETPSSEALSPDDDMKTFIRKRNKQLGRVALK